MTDKLDSLDRSFTKQGFTIISGARDPIGFFSDTVQFPNGQTIIIKMPFTDLSEEKKVLRRYGAVATELVLAVPSIDTFLAICMHDSIPFAFNGDSESKVVTLLDTEPIRLMVIEEPLSAKDTSIKHENGAFRIDWVLLSASADIEKKLRSLLSAFEVRAFHEGCCDYWRLGTHDDFTMIRFEPPLKMKPAPSGWLGVEGGNIYFAY